jgi:glycosyltransferase involved in cell wall biosynthesis
LLWTSAYEGFGFPLAEAAAAHCPTFAVDNSTVPEVTGGNFVLLPDADADAAAEIIATTDLQDGAMRARVTAAKEFSRRFTWSKTAENVWAAWRTGSTRPL